MKSYQITIAMIIVIKFQIRGHESTETNCGRRLVHHTSLITHGSESNVGDWPWHSAIYHSNNFNFTYKCGGTVLSSNAILTAAHCVFENNEPIIPDRVLVYLAKHHLENIGNFTKEFQAYKIISHPNFNTSHFSNDIAIIRLSTEITFNDYIQPICLWESNKVELSEVIGNSGTVVGWGVTETSTLSPILRYTFMPVASSLTCLNSNRDFFGSFLSETTFCAGFRNGTSACNGDSGGSLSFEENGIYRIRGIVSLGVSQQVPGLCNSTEYVVFTDVAKYITWLEEVVPQLKHSGCDSYRFRPISLITNDTLVSGGVDTSGETLYTCRGYYNGDFIPGKGIPKWHGCWIAYNGKENKLTDYEVLTNPGNVNINWKKRPADGSFPKNAIRGGRTLLREPLYIGRCTLQFSGKNTTLIGKIDRSVSSGLYVTYGFAEYICSDYDILVCDSALTWIEEVVPQLNHSGCDSYRFRPISLITDDVLVSGGIDTSGETLYTCRGYYNGDFIPGKGIPKWHGCWIAYNGKEYQLTDYEVLTNPGNANINWKQRPADGSFPANAIRGGRTLLREPLYIGRCTLQFSGKNTTLIGKIDRSLSSGLYVTYGFAEYICSDYDILVCDSALTWIEEVVPQLKHSGCDSYRFRPISLITDDVLVSGGIDTSGETLYTCRGYYNGDFIPGKGIPKWHGCWIAYNGKEYQLTDYEVLTNPGNANINWKQRPADGSFPANAIRGGRTLLREPLYIGRCTLQFSGKNTTLIGKIDRSLSSGLYVTYGFAEYICSDYDILVCDSALTWIEEVVPQLKHSGCESYRFIPISLITDDVLVSGGIDTSGETLYTCRGYYNGDFIPGKGIPKWHGCWIAYNGKEYKLTDYEVLTNPGNANINWKKRPADGSFPANAIRGGRTLLREPLYIGRCTLQFSGKNTTLIGKIDRSVSSGLYVTYGFAEYICSDYDILVCDSALTWIEEVMPQLKHSGCDSYRFRPISLITDDVLVSGGIDTSGETLYTCRGYYNGDFIPGKGIPKWHGCWIAYNGKEYKLTDYEVLTNPGNANINWKKRPADGSFPANAIRGGRTLLREPLYIGRCTLQFSGKNTTLIGKIDRSVSSGLYVTYGSVEYVCNDYDILVCDSAAP